MSFREILALGGTEEQALVGARRDGWCVAWGAEGSPEEVTTKDLHKETFDIIAARSQTIPPALVNVWLAAISERSLEGVFRRRLFALPGGTWLAIAARRLGFIAAHNDSRRWATVREAELAITTYLETGVLPEGITE
jgi:hypothetical protein